jgi:hypothetical protein
MTPLDVVEAADAPTPWDITQLHHMPDALARFDMAIDAVILGLAQGDEPNEDGLAWARRVIEHPGVRPKVAVRAAMTARAHPTFVQAASEGTVPRDIDLAQYVEVLVALLRVRGTAFVPDEIPIPGVVR